jgi:uncharacterized protein (TIGR00730 family)
VNPPDSSRKDSPVAPTVASTRPRQTPLPGQSPKPGHDDPAAAARIATILASASYRQADRDPDFLNWNEMRGLRLAIDYEKAELLLSAARIEHTIIVFGSTHIGEPQAAARHVQALEAAVEAAPTDVALGQRLAVARRLADKSHYYDVARRFGQLVSQSPPTPTGGQLVVMTGGGPGIMEAANRGACDVGAKTVGLNISLPHEQYPNPYVTPELCFSFHYFAMRKLHFLQRARALVAFPGGFGTFDELFETLTLIQTRKMPAVPVVLVGRAYWERAFDIDFLVDEGVIASEDRELFGYAETADDAWSIICDWHRAVGTAGFPYATAAP